MPLLYFESLSRDAADGYRSSSGLGEDIARTELANDLQGAMLHETVSIVWLPEASRALTLFFAKRY